MKADYIGVPFSDHQSLVVKLQFPAHFSKLLSPKSRPLFKANPAVVKDLEFQRRLRYQFDAWLQIRDNTGFMVWWEYVVKPGVKRLLLQRGKEMKKERRGRLNLLLIRQSYLVKKLHSGYHNK